MANKILVVDDDLNICELLKLYLENDGYVVFTANDGQEAVEIFEKSEPGYYGAIFMDIMMPKMDGRIYKSQRLTAYLARANDVEISVAAAHGVQQFFFLVRIFQRDPIMETIQTSHVHGLDPQQLIRDGVLRKKVRKQGAVIRGVADVHGSSPF